MIMDRIVISHKWTITEGGCWMDVLSFISFTSIILYFISVLGLCMGIYVLYLASIALKVYIRKNS